ncbi:MAG: DUF1349 domain-containing protein, partial [Candidatus Bathyarchaeia archaeon]
PLLLIITLSALSIGIAAYYWQQITIPLEVKEPLELLSYPTKLSLYPGQRGEFDIILRNYASAAYSIVLDFSLDNKTYQDNYVTFSNEIYTVKPGEQKLTAWLKVESIAPPLNATLKINLQRTSGFIFFDDFNTPNLNRKWDVIDLAGGSTFSLTANPGYIRITSPPNRDLWRINSNYNAPRIEQVGISGNFTVETKILALPDEKYECCGIYIWKDTDNFLRLDRFYGNPGERIAFQLIKNGETFKKYIYNVELNPTYLRIVRSGDLFSGFYSGDGINWVSCGVDYTFPVSGNLSCGLYVVNMEHSGYFYADFDYFKMTKAP